MCCTSPCTPPAKGTASQSQTQLPQHHSAAPKPAPEAGCNGERGRQAAKGGGQQQQLADARVHRQRSQVVAYGVQCVSVEVGGVVKWRRQRKEA